ncbi:MAG TPA: xanthine dehydrogenase family protein subunit M [Tissierellia bacterium]|jgi:CO/xanthine dehydrogenase FAD-binding subunit|nr:xanthine dehydrogenase family protein subunit M [Tissierellia bacterium]
MRGYFYESPDSFEKLFEVLKDNSREIKFLAGGSDFVPRLNLEREQAPKENKKDLLIINLSELGLNTITENDSEVIIGATTTFTEIQKNDIIKREFPVLIEAINQIAGLSVRNIATIGGNIMNASPAADSVPSLVVLDAVFVLRGPEGSRNVEAKEFFTGPGRTVAKENEVLTHIIIRKNKGFAGFNKLGRRKAETLSVVNAAAYIERENNVCKVARIAVGSVAPTVVRCKEVEELLNGKELTEENIRAASEKVVDEISPIDDIRASAWYRRRVAPVIVRRAIEAAIVE